MPLTITLDTATEQKLRAEAQAQGRPPEELAAERLAAAYSGPPVASVGDEDAEGYAALVAAGDADFAAGDWERLADELAASIPPDTPPLTEAAMSRESIYEGRP